MPLNEGESALWWHAVSQLTASDDLDPIEKASHDPRVIQAAEYLIQGAGGNREQDYYQLLSMVSGEYMISSREVDTALEIAEDRIIRG